MEEKSASLIILDTPIKGEETNNIKKEHGVYDVLELCNVVPNEVLMLSGGKGVRFHLPLKTSWLFVRKVAIKYFTISLVGLPLKSVSI